jgi:hypothetical protein
MKTNNTNDETFVSLDRHLYVGIKELGFTDGGIFTVCLYTTPADVTGKRRGSFSTCIPISPLSYRKKNVTQAAFKRKSTRTIIIYDDRGSSTTIASCKRIIDILEKECRDNGVYECIDKPVEQLSSRDKIRIVGTMQRAVRSAHGED